MQTIRFYNNDRNPGLRERKRLKAFLVALFESERKKLDTLIYVFCSDEYLLGVNKEFLKHDFYTDIITFDLSSNENSITGEVYISIDRIKENAESMKVSFNNELHRVIFHGALHLCGYRDKKPTEIKIMREKEEYALNRYFN